MAWVGRDLKDHPIPTHMLWAAWHPPDMAQDQVAQDPIQPGLEPLQELLNITFFN